MLGSSGHLRGFVARGTAFRCRVYPSINHESSRSRRPWTTSPGGQVSKRGKKTSTSVKLDDLPQGLIALEPLPLEDTSPSYPSVIQQARMNMLKFENCVLLTRVGGFYELYFKHAEEFGPLMNLKVAEKKTNAGPVPMVSRTILGVYSSSDPSTGWVPFPSTRPIFEDPRSRSQPLCCYSR